MATPNQRSQFCTSFDGIRIAYAIAGSGPRLVATPHWLTHLSLDWQNPIRRPWLERVTSSFTLLRTDQRGCGLSDRDVPDVTLESMVRDIEAAIDACGWTRFALHGASQGGAVAIEYATRHPDRVSHLVLYGAYARGRAVRGTARDAAEVESITRLIELGWGGDDPAYHQFFAARIMPDATLQQLQAMMALQRSSTTSANAARIVRAIAAIDVRDSAPRVRCPTLILHPSGDVNVPFEEGRLLAQLIPGARLVPLNSRNHWLLEQDSAWAPYFDELCAFVPSVQTTATGGNKALAKLTERELEILGRLAEGLDNAQIAAHLSLSEKTVRNHVSHILDKIGAENRGKAIIWARDAGLGQRTS